MRCVVCDHARLTTLFPHKAGHMARCESCGLVQLVPMPTAKEIRKLYHEDFSHFAPYLEQIEVHRAYFRQKMLEIGRRVGRKTNKGMKLLDIGCAMGVLLEEAKLIGIEGVGVDISRDAARYCKAKGLNVHAGTIASFARPGLAKRKFDVITAFQIIEHERDPIGFMYRIHKLLKKGGLVVLATPDSGGFWRKIMGRRWFGFAHPEHVVLLSSESMRRLLEISGFRDIEIRRDTPRPFPLSFVFTRGADYFPSLGWILKPIGKLLDRFNIKNPVNPWDDMIVFARV